MPHSTPSYADIRDTLLRDIKNQLPDADISIDSDYYVRASSVASCAEGIYQHQNWIVRQIFPDTADGYLNTQQYLERIIENTTHTNFVVKTYKTLYEKLLQTSDYENYIAKQVDAVVEKRSER